jgi:hypothetical protein
MSVDDTFDVVATKVGIINVCDDELFINCPGSLNHKKYDEDAVWVDLIDNDRALLLKLPEADIFNIYCITNNDTKEYRLVLNSDLHAVYEAKSENEITGCHMEYEGYLYVAPKAMLCDPSSFVSGENIEVDTIKASIKNNEAFMCDFGATKDGNSIVVYVFQVFNEDDEPSEYRFTNNKDLAIKYGDMCEMLAENNLTADLQNINISQS